MTWSLYKKKNPVVAVDTHSVLLVGNSHIYFMTGDQRDNIKIGKDLYQNSVNKNYYIMFFGGSTASGFRPNHISQTNAFVNTYSYIKTLPLSTKIIFSFGQVDLDVLYTYKCIRDNKQIHIDTFIDTIIERYSEGLFEIQKIHPNIALFGINPPSMVTIRSILSITGQQDRIDEYKTLPYDFLLETRTEHSCLFNLKLRTFAEKNGIPYTDAWDRVYDNNHSVTKVLKCKYYNREHDDYHICVKNDSDWSSYFWNKVLYDL